MSFSGRIICPFHPLELFHLHLHFAHSIFNISPRAALPAESRSSPLCALSTKGTVRNPSSSSPPLHRSTAGISPNTSGSKPLHGASTLRVFRSTGTNHSFFSRRGTFASSCTNTPSEGPQGQPGLLQVCAHGEQSGVEEGRDKDGQQREGQWDGSPSPLPFLPASPLRPLIPFPSPSSSSSLLSPSTLSLPPLPPPHLRVGHQAPRHHRQNRVRVQPGPGLPHEIDEAPEGFGAVER
jgi:hypothetical protein